MNEALIKIGIAVSYDYQYLTHSLPLIYDFADEITLAVDSACRTWTGIQFSIPDSFWTWIKQIDAQNKIKVYRDDFYLPKLNAMENGTRERNLMAQFMGGGGWHVTVDCDEYFPDFGAIVRFLRRHSAWTTPGHPPVDIGAFLIPLFKKDNAGFLYINTFEAFPLATNCPRFKRAGYTGHIIRHIPYFGFHQTWARSEEEAWIKVNSTGHVVDFNVQSYYNLWKAVDQHNYRYIRNFHPLIPEVWPSLSWGPGKDIPEFIENYWRNHPVTVPTRLYLRRRLGQMKKKAVSRFKMRHI